MSHPTKTYSPHFYVQYVYRSLNHHHHDDHQHDHHHHHRCYYCQCIIIIILLLLLLLFSTTTEAINIGLQMDAKMIMLNHFSQRYPKVPVFSEKFTNRTGIAFDHMRVSYIMSHHTLQGPFTHVISDTISHTKRALPYPARMSFSRSIAGLERKL